MNDHPQASAGNPPSVVDYSASTNKRLYARRGIRPIGVIVHSTSGQASLPYLQGGVLSEGRVASADALISRDGTIGVIVPFDCYSYHAGVAEYITFGGAVVKDLNPLFLGVELEALNTQGFTLAQYVSLAGYILNKAVAFHWGGIGVILGHYSVARPLGRRSDPLNFDWGRLYTELDYQSRSDWWKGTSK